jgi:hypothetical protein
MHLWGWLRTLKLDSRKTGFLCPCSGQEILPQSMADLYRVAPMLALDPTMLVSDVASSQAVCG